MKKIILAIAGLFMAVLVVVGFIVGASYISATNYGAQIEAQLVAAKDNNKNILAQYEQKMLEAAQVPEMYKNDFKEVVTASLQSRYGSDGSKSVFQWIKEHEINFDSKIYTKLQQLIESGRKDFEVGQTKMIDIRRGYEAQLNYFWRGMWLRVAGYPKINLNEFVPIVTNRVETTFQTGKEEGPLKLR